MTIAELHGKLSPERPHGANDRMEDLLTSDVFGAMRYAGWPCGFLDWLLGAEVPPPLGSAATPIGRLLAAASVTDVHFVFWPHLPNGLEPDVALLVKRQAKDDLVVVVEAKYFSGTSDSLVPGDVDQPERTGFQIPDQVRGLDSASSEELRAWFPSGQLSPVIGKIHLFITRDVCVPTPAYIEALDHLPVPWPVPAFWLSWTSLVECLRPHLRHPDAGRAALIRDLVSLLTRKDLVPFSGFQRRAWSRLTVSPGFWQETWWALTPLILPTSPTFWMPEAATNVGPPERSAPRQRGRHQ